MGFSQEKATGFFWLVTYIYLYIQWNPSCEVTPFATEMWPFNKAGISSGVAINTLIFRFILSSGLSSGVGISSGWPPENGLHT